MSWSTPRLVPLAPETAGNAWAPKAFWDSERASWRLFWASALYPAGPRRHDTSYQRILTSTTQDFVSFSEPRVSIDLGYSVIDATFFVYEGRWFRLTVRHPDRSVPTFVTLEVGSSLLDEDFRIVATDIGEGVLAQGEGPAPAVSSDGTVRLLVDEFLGGGYHVFEITDPLRGTWRPVPDAALPVGARHGSCSL